MILRTLMALGLVLLACGCDTLSDGASSLRERWRGRDGAHSRAYAAEPRTTYEAVRIAASQMGYRYVRGGAAQGQFEAVSAVGSGDRIGTARQLTMRVKLERALDGGTELTVRITEILEADSSNRAGQATETPLRDTPQYEVFLRRVQQALELTPHHK